jgi:hypothetical protein
MRRPDWSRAFFDPIELPNGRQLATLKDAAKYITSLPASEHDLPHWRAAVAALILSAEHGESSADPMLARNDTGARSRSAETSTDTAEEGRQEIQARPLSDSIFLRSHLAPPLELVVAAVERGYAPPACVSLCSWHHSDRSLRCSLMREAAKRRSNKNLTSVALLSTPTHAFV